MSDPNGARDSLPPPEPQTGAVRALAELLVVGGAGLGALFLLVGTPTRTRGATRSAHLEFVERDRHVAEAVAASEGDSAK